MTVQNEHFQQKHPRGSSPQQDVINSSYAVSLSTHHQVKRIEWITPALPFNPAYGGLGEDGAE
jgi:hypothetical protein